MSLSVSQGLAQLRAHMSDANLQAWIVPSADPHLSEYLPEFWKQREYLSGFTGSVGTLVVCQDFAGLWVDSRYWQQASLQLAGTGISLMKLGEEGVLSLNEWLCQALSAGDRVGFNGMIMALKQARQLEADLIKVGVAIVSSGDLVDAMWPDRQALPRKALYEHSEPFVSVSRAQKLAQVRAQMQLVGADYHFISALDDIAWILNLRGSDVDYNPVFLAHLLIDAHKARLFIHEGKVDEALTQRLAEDGVELLEYDSCLEVLQTLAQDACMLIDPARVTLSMSQSACARVIEQINPSQLLKSKKSAQDIANVRQAMEQDGAALCEFFAWFEQAIERGETISELTIDEEICAARARQPHYVCPSFATIAGFNGNGAMPHYRATPESYAYIQGDGLLLIDSGGQYLNGTTDITRVVPVGHISAEQKRDYTTVLKGMIALSRVEFPVGYPAPLLDTLARAPLWQAGLEYGHGTGHGVGYFLNVHEGPQVISYRAASFPHTQMQEGMITSNEPGVYRPGQWGIRIENLVCNTAASRSEFVNTLKFETLTLCPIDTRCIDKTLMTSEEIEWLNSYHAHVRERLCERVSGDALAWLELRTQEI